MQIPVGVLLDRFGSRRMLAAGLLLMTAGQLLFYFTGGQYHGHVAISLGGDQAVSLWNQPRGEYATQRIRVDELAGTVHIGNPPW